MESEGQTQNRGKGFAVLARLIILVVVIAIVIISSVIHKHGAFLREGQTIDLMPYLQSGESLPENEYVHTYAYYVLDEFAYETSSYRSVETTRDSYYAVVLEDGSIIAVKAGDENDLQLLGQASQATLDFIESDTDDEFDVQPVEINGKLTEITDSEIREYYEEYVSDIEDFEIRNMMIDMTAVRAGRAMLFIVIPIILIIILIIVLCLFIRQRKRGKQLAMTENLYPQDYYQSHEEMGERKDL